MSPTREERLEELCMTMLSMLRDLQHDYPWKELCSSYEAERDRAEELGLPVEEIEG